MRTSTLAARHVVRVACRHAVRLGVCLAAALLAGCGLTTVMPERFQEQQALDLRARSVLEDASADDPAFARVLGEAWGCAVFPDVGKGALVLGFAHGGGIFYERGGPTGFCDLSQCSLGLSVGGQGFSEIIFFLTPGSVTRFKQGVFALDANASAVVFALDAAAQGAYSETVVMVIHDATGLMLEASVGFQQLRFQPLMVPAQR